MCCFILFSGGWSLSLVPVVGLPCHWDNVMKEVFQNSDNDDYGDEADEDSWENETDNGTWETKVVGTERVKTKLG